MAISRRNFLVGAAGAGLGFGLGAFSHQFPLAPPHVGPDWAPGEQSFVPSTCLLCPAHCGIRARLVDGRPTRIDGNPLHPVSLGGLCPKGRAGLQLLYHPGRVTAPLERVGPPGSDRFRPITWDAALARVAAALRATGATGGSIDWVVGDVPGVTGDLVAAFCGVFGNARLAVDDYRDGADGVMAMCQGIAAAPAFDLESADVVFSFGAGLAESWSALPLAARARDGDRKRSSRWIQVDVRLSRTAVSADEWIPVRPGSYGALAMGLAYVIAKEGLYDPDAVSQRVSGWEDWTDADGRQHAGYQTLVLRYGRPEDVSARTGVPIARLTALAKTFGSARQAVALWDHAVAWRTGGLADALAIHALNTLTGRLNRPGGLLVQSPMPSLPGPLDGLPPTRNLAKADLVSTTWPVRPAERRTRSEVVFLYQSNPVASSAKTEEVRDALERAPLVVSFSPFLDESARYAHLVLPDSTYLERWQDASAPAAVAFPVWGVVQPVVKPLHDTRATGDVILDLARRVGGDLAAWARWASVQDLVHARAVALAGATRGSAFVDAFRQRELRDVEGRGWWLPHGQSGEEFAQTVIASGGWFDPILPTLDGSALSQHPDGRVWMFPADARAKLGGSSAHLTEGFLPAGAGAPGASTSAFPLQLVPFRVLTLSSGSTPLMPWLLEHLAVLTDSAWETWVEIDPKTAQTYGLASGERVRVESADGSFEATVRVFAGVQPGVVNVPYGLHTRVSGWGNAAGSNPLAAVGRHTDEATGLPDWYSTRVRLARV